MCADSDCAIVSNIFAIFYSIKILSRLSIQYILQQLIINTVVELWFQFCRIILKIWICFCSFSWRNNKIFDKTTTSLHILYKKYEDILVSKTFFLKSLKWMWRPLIIDTWLLLLHQDTIPKCFKAVRVWAVWTWIRIKWATHSNISLTSQKLKYSLPFTI